MLINAIYKQFWFTYSSIGLVAISENIFNVLSVATVCICVGFANTYLIRVAILITINTLLSLFYTFTFFLLN